MRSGLPGMLSETMTRAPLFSLISLTWDPPLPIIIDTSWVTMRQRMWILAAGGGEAVELPGTADVVEEASPHASAPVGEVRRNTLRVGSGCSSAICARFHLHVTGHGRVVA